MTKELVPTNGVLPDARETEAFLVRLGEEGDLERLAEVSHQADAHRQYEVRNKARERANYFGRVKVTAEAVIGRWDTRQHPHPRSGPLEIGGQTVSSSTRSHWRVLGLGLDTGQLDKAINIAADSDTVATYRVAQELRIMGTMFVDTRPLRDRFHELRETEGLTRRGLERAAGYTKNHLSDHFPIEGPPRRFAMNRVMANVVAEVLGVDPKQLKGVPSGHKPHTRRRKRPKPRQLKGGRLDETYTLIRRALDELDRATGNRDKWGTDDAYTHLYQAEEIVGRALLRAT